MQFQWVKNGMVAITKTGNILLESLLASANYSISLVTSDPFTFNFEAVNADYTYSLATGLTNQACDTLTLTGPFVDDATQNVYWKFVGVTFVNSSGGPVTITGAALRFTAGPELEGVLIFDDSEVIVDGGTLTMDILIGIGQPNEDSTLENLVPA